MGDHSPLMFETDEEDDVEKEEDTQIEKDDSNENKIIQESPTKKKVDHLRYVLSGVPPPPTLTFLQMDARHLLELWNQNSQQFNLQGVTGRETSQLENDLSGKSWLDAQSDLYHGIFYNKSVLCEQLEALSLRYQERYVGNETSTSVNSLSSRSPPKTASARKRARRLAHGGHSPGRRLSHLARRRNTFSSLDLRQATALSTNNKMILVNNKSKQNARKRLKNSATKHAAPAAPTVSAGSIPKRALFQSPENGAKKQSKTPVHSGQRTRRALFSSASSARQIQPPRQSTDRDTSLPPVLTRQTTEPGVKRQREGEEARRDRDSVVASDQKRRCTRSLLFEENEDRATPNNSPPLLTAQTLSKLHKRKLLWAVSGALREEGIKTKDTLFQPCATLLFNQCKNIWLKESATKSQQIASTSDKMLEIVKRYCSNIVAKVSAKLGQKPGDQVDKLGQKTGDQVDKLSEEFNDKVNQKPGDQVDKLGQKLSDQVDKLCQKPGDQVDKLGQKFSDQSDILGQKCIAKPPLQTLPQNVLLDNKQLLKTDSDLSKKSSRTSDDASFKNCDYENNDSDTKTLTTVNAS
ncbi:uncharacterized protein LOC120349429 [Nilaparvata lugens]|uniref:uncharacterized protein LOC120349429 n=1 Tax=Nilaparvata lugens TaxID=108931 RepID=UPI00193E5B8B|nr:uncharacterized protein LOC120349429 [Nilaparvata lugens]